MGDVLTRVAYGEHFFQHHGAEVIRYNIDGLELIGWAFTKFWFVDVIPARTFFHWFYAVLKENQYAIYRRGSLEQNLDESATEESTMRTIFDIGPLIW